MDLNVDDPFCRDDLHFRTVTSLLSLFHRPENAHYGSTIPAGSRSNFEQLLAVSFLLTRGNEVVAGNPKRAVEGITLFCMTDRQAKRKEYSRVSKSPLPDESQVAFGCSVRLEDEIVVQFTSTVKYLIGRWCEVILLFRRFV
jgi:hypothetical protein